MKAAGVAGDLAGLAAAWVQITNAAKRKLRSEDRYWYRAVDKAREHVDFLLTAKRDRRAAWRFFTRAVKDNRLLKIVNIDKSGANNAEIKDYNRKHRTTVVIRQCKYKASRTSVVRGSFWVASSLCT